MKMEVGKGSRGRFGANGGEYGGEAALVARNRPEGGGGPNCQRWRERRPLEEWELEGPCYGIEEGSCPA